MLRESKLHTRRNQLLAAVAALTLSGAAAQAATYAWDPQGTPGGDAANPTGSGGDGVWNLSNANWSNGTDNIIWPNLIDDIALFGGPGGTVTVGESVQAYSLRFLDDYTVNGAPGASITLAQADTSTGNTAPFSVEVATGKTVNINVPLAGTNLKFGSNANRGTIVLNTQGTWTGATRIQHGTVKLGVDNALPITSSMSGYHSSNLFDLNGKNQELAGCGGGHTTINSDPNNASTLTINAVSGDPPMYGPVKGLINLVKNGSGTLYIGNADNDFVGTITVNSGALELRNSEHALGDPGNTLALNRQTVFRFNSSVFATTIPQDIVLTGGKVIAQVGDPPTSQTIWYTPQFYTSAAGSLANAITLSGVISGTDDPDYGKAGIYFNTGGFILSGDNTFPGVVRIAGNALIVAAHENAFGVGTGSAEDGIEFYTSGTVAVMNGVKIANERIQLTHQAGAQPNMGNLHALAGGGEWAGPVAVPSAGTKIGADPGETLLISGVMSGQYSAIDIVGGGTVKVTGANTVSDPLDGNDRWLVSSGTLMVSNTTGWGTGDLPVVVGDGGTLAGTGYIKNGVQIQAGGVLAPGENLGTLTVTGGGKNVSSQGFALPGNVDVDPEATVLIAFDTSGTSTLALTAAAGTASIPGALTFSVSEFAPLADGFYDFVIAANISHDPSLDATGLAEALTSYVANGGVYNYGLVTVAPGDYADDLYAGLSALRLEFTAVPEPGSLSLLALGGLGLLRRRRRA